MTATIEQSKFDASVCAALSAEDGYTWRSQAGGTFFANEYGDQVHLCPANEIHSYLREQAEGNGNQMSEGDLQREIEETRTILVDYALDENNNRYSEKLYVIAIPR